MKRIKLLSAFVALFTMAGLGFVSCDSEPLDPNLLGNTPTNPTQDPASFKVNIGDSLFTATSTEAIISGDTIAISGMRGTDGEEVDIFLLGNTTGTYTTALMTYDPTGDGDYQYANFDPNIADNPPYTGSVTISSINTTTHTISGTFNFTGFWSNADAHIPNTAFTHGVFVNIPYTGSPSTTPTNPTPDEYYRVTVADSTGAAGTVYDYTDTMTVASSGGFLTLVGIGPDPDLVGVTVFIKQTLTPGTYAMSDSALADVSASYSVNGPDSYSVSAGTLTIISITDGYIKGTFTFPAVNTDTNAITTVTGEFNVEHNP
jgi:Family of unknown function (DUF6252)